MAEQEGVLLLAPEAQTYGETADEEDEALHSQCWGGGAQHHVTLLVVEDKDTIKVDKLRCIVY